VKAGHQHLRQKRTDLLHGKIHHGHDLSADKFFTRIQRLDLRARYFDSDVRAEIDAQLPRRFTRFGKFHHLKHRADAQLDFQKLIPLNLLHGIQSVLKVRMMAQE